MTLSPDTALALARQWPSPAPAWPAAGEDQLTLAWAFKDLCYQAWSSDPAQAARAAEGLSALAEATSPGPQTQEINGLAAWTAGIACLTRGEMAEAVLCFDRAAAALHAAGRHDPAAQSQVPKIMALSMAGQHAAAAACAEATQRELLALGNRRAAARVSQNVGVLQLRGDAYAEAARHFRQASVLFARLGDPVNSVLADIGLADTLSAQGDFDEALRIYARARMRAGNQGLTLQLALVDESVALLDLARGQYRAALAGMESARRRYQSLAMPHYLAIAEKQLGDAYLDLRLLPEALALLDAAVAQFQALALPVEQAWALVQRGRAQALLKLPAANASLAGAAELFKAQANRAGSASVALVRCELALAAGQTEAALAWAGMALAGFADSHQADGLGRAQVLQSQAWLQAGRLSEAAAGFEAALAQAVAGQQLAVQVRCLTGQGLVAQATGDAALASASFEAAIEAFEDQRRALPGDELRSAFLTSHLAPFEHQFLSALQAGDARTALWQLERYRARALDDDLTEGPTQSAAAAPIQALRERLNWLYRRVQRLHDEGESSASFDAEILRLEAELLEHARRARLAAPMPMLNPAPAAGPGDCRTWGVEAKRVGPEPNLGPDFRGVLAGTPRKAGTNCDSSQPVAADLVLPPRRLAPGFSIEALQAALQADDALVEYGLQDDQLLAFVVTRDQVTLHRRLALWPEVVAAAQSLRFQIETLRHGSGPVRRHLPVLTARAQARAAQLHRLIWAPLELRLANRRRVLVVPQGPLSAVPFAALGDGSATLGQRHQLAMAPSARTAWRGLHRQPVTAQNAVALGVSSQLPQAGDEARFVARLFAHGMALLGEQASLAQLRQHAATADVLHLACHAQFRSDNPRFSALHLADGALTVEWVEQLRLRAAIVVLSACETGLAQAGAGDEMVGLVRAFLVAGAARVLASQWPVDDAVTFSFMREFYDALTQGAAPASALQSAQTAIALSHPHPYFWAAFTLYGGW